MHPDFGTVWDGAPIWIPFVVVDGSRADVPIGRRARCSVAVQMVALGVTAFGVSEPRRA